MYQRFYKRFTPQQLTFLLCLIMSILTVGILLGVRFFSPHDTLEEKYTALMKELFVDEKYSFNDFAEEYYTGEDAVPEGYYPCPGKTYERYAEVAKHPEKACSLVIATLPELRAFPTISSKLKNLKMLKITNTQRTEVPPEIGELSNLRRFVLQNTERTILPPEIGKLSLLVIIWMENAHVREIPSTIGNLINLEQLHIVEDKELNSLPPEIGKLKKLTVLDFYASGLSFLPDTLVNLTNLESITLSDNKFTEFPRIFLKMPQISSLYLDGNMISYIPEEFVKRELFNLDMSRNKLTSFPSLVDQKKLYYLDLHSNKLLRVPELPKGGSLDYLDLGSNQLTSIPPEISSFTNLLYLYLDHNQLTTLPPLDRLTKLQELFAGDNQLTSIPSVSTLTLLEVLDIRNNRLSSLPEGLEHLHKLRELSIEGNNFKQAEIEKVKKLFPYTPITY